MMKPTVRCTLTVVLAAALAVACATPYQQFPQAESQRMDPGRYDKKADHLIIVLDASSSMADGVQEYRKLDVARDVVRHFNDTMPDLDITVALRSFGHAESVSPNSSAVLLPARPYSRDALSAAVDKVQAAGGASPLGRSLNDATDDLATVAGRIAMVIVSDGKDMASDTLAAANALQAAYQGRLCIYTVQVGDSAEGAALLGKLAALSSCGAAVTAGQVRSGSDMGSFVQTVLLAAKGDSDGDGVTDDTDRCPDTPRGVQVDADGCPLDSDRDGVFDFQDACPDTPAGTSVDGKGCPIPKPVATSAEKTDAGTYVYRDIQFENNQAVLKASSFPALNEVTELLKARPDLNIEIHGHTDGSGSRAYNMDLSRRRAEAVKTFLASKGIAAARMTTKAFGPDRPVDSNATAEGRARNRRVEFKPVAQ